MIIRVCVNRSDLLIDWELSFIQECDTNTHI